MELDRTLFFMKNVIKPRMSGLFGMEADLTSVSCSSPTNSTAVSARALCDENISLDKMLQSWFDRMSRWYLKILWRGICYCSPSAFNVAHMNS